ncbi:hypothetical protein RJ641_010377 [Dillenia turbinata]|uniref:Uncharacterized protein n=1 Tax=Dillenia turbinata TaxID=194707 RepID=A0AAN8VBE8_9MAGN
MFPKGKKGISHAQPEPRQKLDPSAKIKLQLFPLDDYTGKGLEMDIIHTGNLLLAAEEPVLFPFDMETENVARCRRWTLADCDITTGDVYVTIGASLIFRLRLWQPSQLSLFWTDSLTNISIGGLLSEDAAGKVKAFGSNKALVMSDSLTNISIVGLLSETSCKASSSLWIQGQLERFFEASLQAKFKPLNPKSVGNSSGSKEDQALSTNRSFTGLLFEESQQGKLKTLDLKSVGNSLGLQESQVICDSPTNIGGLLSEASMQGKFKPLDPKSVGSCSGLQLTVTMSWQKDHACQVLNTDLSLGSRFHNDESSLGLAGFKWTTDSLGPFDLGISSWHLLSGRQF